MTILVEEILVKRSEKSELSVKVTFNKNDKWKILNYRLPLQTSFPMIGSYQN